jgi:hypothetical protein
VRSLGPKSAGLCEHVHEPPGRAAARFPYDERVERVDRADDARVAEPGHLAVAPRDRLGDGRLRRRRRVAAGAGVPAGSPGDWGEYWRERPKKTFRRGVEKPAAAPTSRVRAAHRDRRTGGTAR